MCTPMPNIALSALVAGNDTLLYGKGDLLARIENGAKRKLF